MKYKWCSLVALSLAHVPHSYAWVPPPTPVDEAALAEARQLVEHLPLGVWPDRSGRAANVEAVLAWATQADLDHLADEDLRRVIASKVEQETQVAAKACLPLAKEVYAESFARMLSAADIRAAAEFLRTKPGERFGFFVSDAPFAATMQACTHKAIVPRAPDILRSALESNEIRRQINARANGKR